MNLEDHLQSAQKSLFRFEYLQEFDVSEESELFRTYQATGKVEIRDMMQDWWEFLEKKHQQGVLTQRVRLVRFPVSKYVEWELFIHRQASKHGDDIRTLNEKKLTPELEVLGDFWLIDELTALKMNYDSAGKYIGFEKVEFQPYLKAKKYLLANSISI